MSIFNVLSKDITSISSLFIRIVNYFGHYIYICIYTYVFNYTYIFIYLYIYILYILHTSIIFPFHQIVFCLAFSFITYWYLYIASPLWYNCNLIYPLYLYTDPEYTPAIFPLYLQMIETFPWNILLALLDAWIEYVIVGHLGVCLEKWATPSLIPESMRRIGLLLFEYVTMSREWLTSMIVWPLYIYIRIYVYIHMYIMLHIYIHIRVIFNYQLNIFIWSTWYTYIHMFIHRYRLDGN